MDQILGAMILSVTEAGEASLKHFNKGINTKAKTSHHDIVTKADYEAQKIIQKVLHQNLPSSVRKDIGIIGEEDNLSSYGKFTFVIDPIDGTTNFASGIPYFGHSVGCIVDGTFAYGVIYNSVLNELFYASKNNGAFVRKENKETKLIIQKKPIKECVLGTYIHGEKQIRGIELKFYDAIQPHIRAVRALGSVVNDSTLLSQNVLQILMYGGVCKLWDVAAAKVLIEEAGGILTDLNNKPLTLDIKDRQKGYAFMAGYPNTLGAISTFY